MAIAILEIIYCKKNQLRAAPGAGLMQHVFTVVGYGIFANGQVARNLFGAHAVGQ